MSNPLKPSLSLLCKLGSVIVHFEEADSGDGHAFDWAAIHSILFDPEVIEWRKAMDAMAMLPRKRKI